MDDSTYSSQNEHRTSKRRVAKLAERQFGRVTWAQLRTLGAAPGTISRWVSTGYLIRALPRVYAVGHAARDEHARLFELILFAGPNAALSHGTAAHWRGWLRYPVRATHVSTPRRIRAKLRSVAVHGERTLGRELIDGIPCTTVAQTLLDLAATEPPKLVKRALAQLDFERRLDPDAVRDACRDRRHGSPALLTALDTYIPQMARTKSDLEDDFLLLCQRFGIALPEVNVPVHGIEVDCHWPELNLVVELDGDGNHGTAAQRNRDQRKALKLRAHGIPMIRYTWHQVNRQAHTVAADVTAQIEHQRRGARSLS